jgi:DnaJ-class molecular chaperone
MALEFKDYYKTLGVDKTADDRAIKQAYRRLARKYHPDLNKSKGAADRFKEINEANEVLSDPEKRRRYDALGPDWQRYAQTPPGGPGGPFPGGYRVEYSGDAGDLGGFSDFFRTIFGDLGARQAPMGDEDVLGAFGRRRRPTRSRGEDVHASVQISLEDAFQGARRTIVLDAEEPCATCRGAGHIDGRPCPTCGGRGWQPVRRTLEVRIPAGVKTGSRVRVTGEGAGGAARTDRGDLYLTVTVADHPLFERRGDDLHLELPVTVPEAALGTTIDVPTLKGKVSMKVPPATSSGRTFRLPGYGIPHLKGGGSGDQLVRIKIVLPASLAERERALYEQLKGLRMDNPRAYMG